jgi:glycosyltransferase involved in cell wall biosynthesis
MRIRSSWGSGHRCLGVAPMEVTLMSGMNRPARGRVALIYPRPDFDTVPSLTNAVEVLASAGYYVDVLTYTSPTYVLPSPTNPLVKLRVPPLARRLSERLREIGWHPGPRATMSPLQRIQASTLWFVCRAVHTLRNPVVRFYRLQQMRLLHRRVPYRCVIGVDPLGLVLAARWARSMRIPHVYWSLELLMEDEIKGRRDAELKRLERSLGSKSAITIVQDPERAQLLVRESRVRSERIVLVPNAPMGPARRRPSRYWHRYFKLPDDSRVVLYAGSLSPWSALDDVVQAVRSWPSGWIFVIHSRSDASIPPDVARYADQRNSNVYVSRSPVPGHQFERLVDGADIGIAFYRPLGHSTYTQKNLETLGLSSGKVANYLRAGLPVILNATTSLASVIKRARCGIVVQDGNQIPAAISAISNRYAQYSESATRLFDSELAFQANFAPVMRLIEEMETGTEGPGRWQES